MGAVGLWGGGYSILYTITLRVDKFMIDKRDLVNYTLRFPEDYRKRLEMEAQSRGRSLNQQIVRIIEMYFADSGYATELVTFAGESFRIHCAPAYDTAAETAWDFALENLRTGKEEAYFVIGMDRAFSQTLNISNRAQAAKEIGLSLLNFHARRGRDLRTLCWMQPLMIDGKRILMKNEVSAETLPDFLEMLAKGRWADHWLVPDKELEAINMMLITAKIEHQPVIKHMDDSSEMWVQIGDRKFDGQDRNLYVQALTKMDQLRLVELQAQKQPSINTYHLTPRAVQHLAKIATLST